MMPEIRMLEIKDLQKILKIGRNVAYNLMKMDSFPSIQIGRKYLVEEKALREWLDENKYCKIIVDE